MFSDNNNDSKTVDLKVDHTKRTSIVDLKIVHSEN